MTNVQVLSFSAGELSPQVDCRADLEKYHAGCRSLENMVPRIYGSAERRPGTRFVWGIWDVTYGSGLYGAHSYAG